MYINKFSKHCRIALLHLMYLHFNLKDTKKPSVQLAFCPFSYLEYCVILASIHTEMRAKCTAKSLPVNTRCTLHAIR